MKKYLLLASVVLAGTVVGGAYAAIDCSTPPSCGEMGYSYSEDQCSGQKILRCPFDETQVFCSEPSGSSLSEEIPCEIGSVLYDDKKCYTSAPSGKNPIGVVFNTDKRLAISVTASKTSVQWGGYGTDISDLPNCTSASVGTCSAATDGEDNTNKIVAAIGSDSAAGWCKSTGGFLPSASELFLLKSSSTKEKVNAGLSTLPNANTILLGDSGYYLSSNEISSTNVLSIQASGASASGLSTRKTQTGSALYVRCAVSY